MKTGCVGVGVGVGGAAMKNKEEGGGEKKGPWTPEEDELLTRYVTSHGERHWNLVAKSSGLKRIGKSCRLRWMNYLKPGIKRGDLTPEEQLKIFHLHSQLGNKWSKIAASLPGRTDNEIKNYWRTRVEKYARQLKMDSNSQSFNHAIWRSYVPRLLQKIEQNSTSPTLLTCEGSSAYCPTMLASDINKATACPNISLPNTSFSEAILQPMITSASFANGTTVNSSRGSSLVAGDGYYVNSSKYDDMDLGSMSGAYNSLFDCHAASQDWLWDDMAEYGIWGLNELW